MVTYAVVKTGGKQYLVKEGMTITVDQLNLEKGKKLELETLLKFDEEGKAFELGKPLLKEKVSAEVIDNIKGDKIRIAKFKAKSRYRKVRGFRAKLTQLKILKI
ncbi:MAG: 50S ribosomal protein L21 [Candidatus Roizmanbacteria bacterium]|nr:50S ribosomal protein L21 [Candidatus Roizmanbacteria bacterium]